MGEPNPIVAPFVKIDYEFQDSHRDFDVDLDDDIKNHNPPKPLIFDVVGVIVKVHPDYVLVYVPLPKFWKVLIKRHLLKRSPFGRPHERTGQPIQVGEWLGFSTIEKPIDEQNATPAEYSHVAFDPRDIVPFDVKQSIPQWEQRFKNGVFQAKMKIPLDETALKPMLGNYWIADSGVLQALVPDHRLRSIFKDFQFGSRLHFWVNRGRLVGDYCTHLFEDEPIEEHRNDGTILIHRSPLKHPEEFELVQTAGLAESAILPSKSSSGESKTLPITETSEKSVLPTESASEEFNVFVPKPQEIDVSLSFASSSEDLSPAKTEPEKKDEILPSAAEVQMFDHLKKFVNRAGHRLVHFNRRDAQVEEALRQIEVLSTPENFYSTKYSHSPKAALASAIFQLFDQRTFAALADLGFDVEVLRVAKYLEDLKDEPPENDQNEEETKDDGETNLSSDSRDDW